eukprot:gene2067-2387_t
MRAGDAVSQAAAEEGLSVERNPQCEVDHFLLPGLDSSIFSTVILGGAAVSGGAAVEAAAGPKSTPIKQQMPISKADSAQLLQQLLVRNAAGETALQQLLGTPDSLGLFDFAGCSSSENASGASCGGQRGAALAMSGAADLRDSHAPAVCNSRRCLPLDNAVAGADAGAAAASSCGNSSGLPPPPGEVSASSSVEQRRLWMSAAEAGAGFSPLGAATCTIVPCLKPSAAMVAIPGVLQQQRRRPDHRESGSASGEDADLGDSDTHACHGRRSSDETAWTSTPPSMQQLSAALPRAQPIGV